ncbi:MAG: PilZ domain-containing protein [Candidatus Omnitrophica bacterium]|nr:PilZ domain-containing protein [Candidatus Omnitrophota bacterium]
MAQIVTEKRLRPRIDSHTPLRYQIRGDIQHYHTISNNLSEKGISFRNPCFLSPGTAVMLEFSLLKNTLRPIGRVRWSQQLPHSHQYQIGVEFIEFQPQERNFLGDFIHLQLGTL